MRKWIVFIIPWVPVLMYGQATCYEHRSHPMPVLSAEAKNLYLSKLDEAQKNYDKDSTHAEAIIWLGRRIAYLGNYNDAIRLFTKGMELHPDDARFYRHRGHRYITLRCFEKAIADFKKAASLIKGKPDETEPDGLPNAKNIPTSTLQSNIWYHLGLCYYITGQYKKALRAYRNCLAVSKNNDMYVATANWMYITLRRLNKKKEAEKLLATVSPDMEIIENKDYHEILMLYKSLQAPADPLHYLITEKKDLGLASFGYGLGNYLLEKGDKQQAKKIFQHIVNSNQWAAFGYMAAEADLLRLK